ncbi:hypothetical protein NPX13_g3385 [Xylaria arbuscula]|uniref:Uncharacterized protein n=1 Tax=Xylaria arbuscula TaxID=114810 RepID=A0A9W8NIK1_9PEZI|nr:hypothetical protein NPX13_g3385 [Xylaria arbuscula]
MSLPPYPSPGNNRTAITKKWTNIVLGEQKNKYEGPEFSFVAHARGGDFYLNVIERKWPDLSKLQTLSGHVATSAPGTLRRLPLELRFMIYDCSMRLMSHTVDVRLMVRKLHGPGMSSATMRQTQPFVPAIAKVCRLALEIISILMGGDLSIRTNWAEGNQEEVMCDDVPP